MRSLKLNKTNFTRRITVTFIIMSLMFGCIAFPALVAGGSSASDQIAAYEKKLAEEKAKREALKDDNAQISAKIESLQKTVDIIQAEIDSYNSEISSLKQKIAALDQEKADTEADLAQKKEIFLERIRAMYISSNSSTLSLILSADDFGDFLYKYELVNKVTEDSDTLIKQLNAEIKRIDEIVVETAAEEKKQEELKSEVDAKQADLTSTINELNSEKSSNQEAINDSNEKTEEYNAAIDKLEAQIAAAAKKAQGSSVVYDGAAFLNPVGSFNYIISSEYGYRWGKLHKGIDIAGSGIYGANIYASAAGVVILAGYDANGYGNYIMINHGTGSDGNNYITLYGHCSSISVSTGQTVSAGQVIGAVGNSGYSTGPHLHFEIRINGTAVNPRSVRSF